MLLLSRDEHIIEQLFNYSANYGILTVLNTKDSIIKSTPILQIKNSGLNDNDESNLMQCIPLYNDINLPYDDPKPNQLFQDPSYVKNKNDELIYIIENYLFNNLNKKEIENEITQKQNNNNVAAFFYSIKYTDDSKVVCYFCQKLIRVVDLLENQLSPSLSTNCLDIAEWSAIEVVTQLYQATEIQLKLNKNSTASLTAKLEYIAACRLMQSMFVLLSLKIFINPFKSVCNLLFCRN